MTDEFQKGLITGLAMQPLQVTTEHAESDPVVAAGFVQAFGQVKGILSLIHAVGETPVE